MRPLAFIIMAHTKLPHISHIYRGPNSKKFPVGFQVFAGGRGLIVNVTLGFTRSLCCGRQRAKYASL